MAEIDPLIFKLIADTKAARAEVKAFQSVAGQGFARTERDILRLETQIRRSSGAIGSSIKGLAASLAAGFSVQQITQLADGYTRFQNSLKVTGLEGERLAQTQEKLFAIAQKYGVQLESVGSLYGRTAQSQDALGASSADLVNVSEAVSASLKILPADAGAVQGALTQLGQAFASPRVQAEEFNSIVDVLTPLMQEAAKHIEGTGGTLAGLKQKLKDTKGEGVSNVELFRAIAASLEELQKKAASADQTIGSALTKLNNALGLYIGQTDDGLSATERMAGAIELLAENIDVVANSLAILTALVAGRFVVGLVATQGALAGTASAMGAVGAASFAMQARAAGAATSMEALTFAARGFAATGIGLVVTAAAVGIGYLAAQSSRAEAAAGQLSATIAAQAAEFGTLIQRQRESDAATNNLDAGQRSAINSTAALTGEAHLLANAWARVAAEAKRAAIEQAQAAQSQALTNLTAARAAFDAKRDAEFQKRAIRPFAERGLGRDAPAVNSQAALRGADQAVVGSKEYSDLLQGTATLNALNRRVQDLKNQSLGDFRPSSGGGAAASGGKGSGGGSAPSGPSVNEIQTRFQQEYDNIAQQILSAQQGVALSAKDRADLERQSVDMAQKSALASLAADSDYSAGQKELIAQQIRKLGDAERARVALNEQVQTEQDAADLAQTRYDIEADALRNQYDLATTEEDRRIIALKILDAEDAYLRSKLDATRLSKVASKAEKDRAELALAALDASAPVRRRIIERQNQGALDRYIEGMSDPAKLAEEATVRQLQEVNRGIVDALTDQLGIKSQYVKDLLSIFLEQALFRPIAEALRRQQSGGGGGGIFSTILSIGSSLFGGGSPGSSVGSGASNFNSLFAGARASGGHVNAGTMYRFNEGASPGRVEGFMPDGSGTIIPLGQMNAMAARSTSQTGGVVRIVVEEGPNFMSTIRTEAVGVSVEVYRQGLPGTIEAAKQATLRAANRPEM